jgi:Flp pilus assembly protein TadG
VEFAIVAPVFFLLIFGMIEFGRMVMVQQVITNASREGARVAVLDGTTLSEINTQIDNYLQSAHLSSAAVDVTAIDDETGGGKPYEQSDYADTINVTVSIPFGQVSWLPSSFFINDDTVLTATTSMRRETVQ